MTRYYGDWAGQPLGSRENYSHCVAEVWPADARQMIPHQCGRNRGHGEGELFCAQHAKRQCRVPDDETPEQTAARVAAQREMTRNSMNRTRAT